MNVVLMRVSNELFNEMFALGGNRMVVGAFVRDDLARQIVFQIADMDAPDDATYLEPVLYKNEDGSVRLEPHYR